MGKTLSALVKWSVHHRPGLVLEGLLLGAVSTVILTVVGFYRNLQPILGTPVVVATAAIFGTFGLIQVWLTTTSRRAEAMKNILDSPEAKPYPLVLGTQRMPRAESRLPAWSRTRTPPYKISSKLDGGDQQVVIWYRAPDPQIQIRTKFVRGRTWWKRFQSDKKSGDAESKDLLYVAGLARRQLEHDFIVEKLEKRERPFLEPDLRLEGARETTRDDKAILDVRVGRASYLDRIWTGTRANQDITFDSEPAAHKPPTLDKRLASEDDRKEAKKAHCGEEASLENCGSWPRSCILHTCILLITKENKVLVMLRGPNSEQGEGDPIVSAAGAAHYYRSRPLLARPLPQWALALLPPGLSRTNRMVERGLAAEIREELGKRVKPERLSFWGIASYPSDVGWDPEFHFYGRINMTKAEIEKSWLAAHDNTEGFPQLLSYGELLALGSLHQVTGFPRPTNEDREVLKRFNYAKRRLRPPLIAALHFLAIDKGFQRLLNGGADQAGPQNP